jgi:hypothetical protein
VPLTGIPDVLRVVVPLTGIRDGHLVSDIR